MRVLDAQQMREADRRAIQILGIPSAVLMENAGRQVLAAMADAFGSLAGRRIGVLAGKGNNGGDGFVVARGLLEQACELVVWLVGAPDAVKGDARTNLDILRKLGVPVATVRSVRAWQRQRVVLGSCDILVDALFGTGISAPLDGLQRTIVEDVNACGVPVVSIDLPSGLSADRTAPIGPAIAAWLTVTLGAPKLPLVMSPADAHTGALVVADIGIPRRVIEAVDGPRVEYTLRDDVRGLLPARADDSHKGTFGRVCVVAGSRGKSGAAHLAGMAALKSGAGLVSIATPCSCAPVVASMAAEYMTTGLNETADGCLAGDSWKAISVFDGHVVVMGPGIGTGAAQQACVERVLAKSRRPLVLDADALTVLAMSATPLKARRGQVVVVTPHPGEMARLVGGSVADVQARRIDVARDYACERGVIVVLKGHRTVIAAPDGRVFVNSTGNPGMATGGSGDVLSGAIAAWLAQLDDAVDACRLAVYLHGFAGDMAAQVEGQPGMTAGDILRHLGAAQIALARPEEADADV